MKYFEIFSNIWIVGFEVITTSIIITCMVPNLDGISILIVVLIVVFVLKLIFIVTIWVVPIITVIYSYISSFSDSYFSSFIYIEGISNSQSKNSRIRTGNNNCNFNVKGRSTTYFWYVSSTFLNTNNTIEPCNCSRLSGYPPLEIHIYIPPLKICIYILLSKILF